MPVQVFCIECGTGRKVGATRAKTFRFCSYDCRGKWRSKHWTGKNHPRWQEGPRSKKCKHCQVEFTKNKTEAISTFRGRKFCSKACADIGGFRYTGEDHPNYRKEARRKNRGGPHRKWVDAVISRDLATCQHCGAKEVELHAHHIKSYRDHPDLRFDVNNGITLCYKCHWSVHTAENDNGVNSGKLLTGNAEDNPEPSPSGNIREGVTTRGRAYRRWEGYCSWCGEFISRRLSDVTGKSAIFCDGACRGRWTSLQKKGKPRPKAVISSKSAPRETEDIV